MGYVMLCLWCAAVRDGNWWYYVGCDQVGPIAAYYKIPVERVLAVCYISTFMTSFGAVCSTAFFRFIVLKVFTQEPGVRSYFFWKHLQDAMIYWLVCDRFMMTWILSLLLCECCQRGVMEVTMGAYLSSNSYVCVMRHSDLVRQCEISSPTPWNLTLSNVLIIFVHYDINILCSKLCHCWQHSVVWWFQRISYIFYKFYKVLRFRHLQFFPGWEVW